MHFMPHKRRHPPSVIIVSLIDVLIVVLIFLMVSTTFKNRQPAVKIALPVSKQAKEGATESSRVVVTIAKVPPYFYVDTLPMTAERLEAELVARAKKDPDMSLAIRADGESTVERLMTVMDAANAANIRVVDAFTKDPVKP